ncbi:MAG: hypothetical protein OER95_01620, partial [Acidimicrobiia bacterium]|nr:hypothetical protein [Acidimicrobiia bacterium]
MERNRKGTAGAGVPAADGEPGRRWSPSPPWAILERFNFLSGNAGPTRNDGGGTAVGNKISRSLNRVQQSLREKGGHFVRAGQETHHLHVGPGPQLEAEWQAAGLTLPDLDAMRHYRIDRIR